MGDFSKTIVVRGEKVLLIKDINQKNEKIIRLLFHVDHFKKLVEIIIEFPLKNSDYFFDEPNKNYVAKAIRNTKNLGKKAGK